MIEDVLQRTSLMRLARGAIFFNVHAAPNAGQPFTTNARIEEAYGPLGNLCGLPAVMLKSNMGFKCNEVHSVAS